MVGKHHLAQQKNCSVSSNRWVQGRAGKDVLCKVLRLAALDGNPPQQETRDPLYTGTEITGWSKHCLLHNHVTAAGSMWPAAIPSMFSKDIRLHALDLFCWGRVELLFPLSLQVSLSPVQAAECQVFSIFEFSQGSQERSAGHDPAQFKEHCGNIVKWHWLTEYDTMNTSASAPGQGVRYNTITPCAIRNLQLYRVIKYTRTSGRKQCKHYSNA